MHFSFELNLGTCQHWHSTYRIVYEDYLVPGMIGSNPSRWGTLTWFHLVVVITYSIVGIHQSGLKALRAYHRVIGHTRIVTFRSNMQLAGPPCGVAVPRAEQRCTPGFPKSY